MRRCPPLAAALLALVAASGCGGGDGPSAAAVDGFELEVQGHSDEDRGSLQLEAGTYRIYCDVPGHEQAGMVATLEVG